MARKVSADAPLPRTVRVRDLRPDAPARCLRFVSASSPGYIRLKRTNDDGDRCVGDKRPLQGVACALDDHGNTIDVEPVEVCGTSAVLFDASYPTGVHHLK